MTPWHLIIREILHRKLDFALGVLAVLIAVTALVSVTEVIERHDSNTAVILKRVWEDTTKRVDAKEIETAQRVKAEKARVIRDVEAKRGEVAREVKTEQARAVAEVSEHETEVALAVKTEQDEVAAEVAKNEAEVATEVAKLDDEIRKIMKKMGFNIFILPKRPKPTSLLLGDAKPVYMPEQYITRLANNTIITVRHLLPLLECRVEWPEQGGGEVILVGMRGEVPLVNRIPKKPIAQPVKAGTIILGYKVWNRAKIKVGQTITLLGRKFTVAKCYPQRGPKTEDDKRVWVSLAEAQELLHAKRLIPRKKVITAIWALECRCAWRDLSKVRQEIEKILPDTEVFQDESKALARAEAREKVEQDGKARIERIKKDGLARVERVRKDGLAQVKRIDKSGRVRIEHVREIGLTRVAGAEREGQMAIRRARQDGIAEVKRARDDRHDELARRKTEREDRQDQLKGLRVAVYVVSIVGAAAWVGLMAYGSVRRRRREIGILRAIGVRTGQVAVVFLARAVFLGLVGGAAGCWAGLAAGKWLAEAAETSARPSGFAATGLLIVMLGAAALSALATVGPAVIAGQQDPAIVLQEE